MIEYSVSEISHAIKVALDRELSTVCVRGEITGFKPASSGHWYFSLKDNDSVIRAVMFKGRAQALGFMPKDGSEVLVFGSIDVYAKRGEYQINCQAMEDLGQGNLLVKIEQLKQKLLAEGVFDASNKQNIPPYPRKIAVVTSPTGAVIRDILRVLARRSPGLDVVVVPCLVQGAEAPRQIVKAIRLADEHRLGELIIVARGGGSTEDLMAFNDESVVRAIASCQTPIISAIGHETDTTLSDLACDLRAPTPSIAAELVSEGHFVMHKKVTDATGFIIRTMKQGMSTAKRGMSRITADDLLRFMQAALHPYYQRLDDAKEDLIDRNKDRLIELGSRFQLARQAIESASPELSLKRGFVMVKKIASQKLIGSKDQIDQHDKLELIFADGRVKLNTEKED